MSPLVAGVDCSTQGTKVLVVDPDDGTVVASGRAPHAVTGSDGARETDPEIWWEALRAALAETGRAGEVRAISVAGQQHGLFLTERLSGRGATDRGDASGTAWWSTRDERYADEVLELIQLDRALLPEVLGPDDAAGEVSGSTAARVGLPAGANGRPRAGEKL